MPPPDRHLTARTARHPATEQLGAWVHLSSPVQRIAHDATGIEVVSPSLTVRAQRVIVATPPVPAGRITFDPPLPALYSHLPQRVVPGAIIRVHTVYPQPFWREQHLSGQTLAPRSPVPYGSALREPVGRIHWAGTESATLMHGLMEGAVRSGERAAQDILVALARARQTAGLPDRSP
ncbi:flavin monoamine oxidase family protein [Streptomyces sp. NPDC048516]|uniref:flavin monoamine oxidase family protein n=1 Tax=Streptomyces sp. NPDC048516 TaxID=3365565 RepID=UPI00371A991E